MLIEHLEPSEHALSDVTDATGGEAPFDGLAQGIVRGRRARDRALQHQGRANPALASRELENLILLVDDDLRETALAIDHVEHYLIGALAILEKADLSQADLTQLAGDERVIDRLDYLSETLSSLRRRLAGIARRIR